MNNDFFGPERGDSPIVFMSDAVTSKNYWQITWGVTKTRYSWQVIYYSISYVLSLELKHYEIENCHQSITAPFLFTMSQSIALLWYHRNTYCDIILTICPWQVSKLITCVFPPSSGWLSLFDNQVRFHCLVCKKVTLTTLFSFANITNQDGKGKKPEVMDFC